jgi:hypothetical protein
VLPSQETSINTPDFDFVCFLIVMRPVRTRTPGGTRAFQTNGPHHSECTVANNSQQSPPFEHARHVSGPVHD